MYTIRMHTKHTDSRPNVRCVSSVWMLLDNIYMPKKCIMHSQRDYSSTVSTGLSTISQGKSGGISRFSPEISTLSTGFPQVLSTIHPYVDMHVDISFRPIFPVYTCYTYAYLYAYAHILRKTPANSGYFSPEIYILENFRP